MSEFDFATEFSKLTGKSPFPWQTALYERFIKGPDSIPARCDIPTGLGKTSVIAIWLLARERCPALPRRLVYVVNRRTVVDQTTTEVERYKEHRPDLAISTLRGQYVDNREWSIDPSRTAVICGTVDMIGSRLLFSGYGIGRNTKPLHAGFLGQDSLVVHDEAHLEPAFQQLLLAIEKEQTAGRFPDRHPLRVIELSATSRGHESGIPFTLTPDDRQHDVVKKRIHSRKWLVLHPVDDEKKQLADKLIELALTHKDSGRAILVFVRTVDDLGKIVAKLPKEHTRQLTGTMRGYERDTLIRDEVFKRFLPEAGSNQQTVYLVCTSAGEVGVNISADHLVCDLSTFESMAQRFGRVNRFGLRDDTRIDVVHPTDFDQIKVIEVARERTLNLLQTLSSDASPDALANLDSQSRVDAFAPMPVILPVTDILFDAWSMTSITGTLPGRPKVEPYLHGITDWEPPQTSVAWREEVRIVTGDLRIEYPPESLLEEYPLKPHELLSDRTDRVWKELVILAKRFPGTPAWIVDADGSVEVLADLSEVTTWDKKRAESRLGDKTVLLPHDVGGLTSTGLLDGNCPPPSDADELPYAKLNDVADRWIAPDGTRMRYRQWQNREGGRPVTEKEMKRVEEIRLMDLNEEDPEPLRTWHWFVRLAVADIDARSNQKYGLQPHLNDANEAATGFVAGLSLDPELRRVVVLAARYHDLGKDRQRWQNSIGNRGYETTKEAWAKSGKRQAVRERTLYRHEFGSLLDIRERDDFKSLAADSQELALHLIAAHHGRARPHFTDDEAFDDKHPDVARQDESIQTPRRFARLQRKYGRWGLAYLESLVRAADYAASAKAEGGAK